MRRAVTAYPPSSDGGLGQQRRTRAGGEADDRGDPQGEQRAEAAGRAEPGRACVGRAASRTPAAEQSSRRCARPSAANSTSSSTTAAPSAQPSPPWNAGDDDGDLGEEEANGGQPEQGRHPDQERDATAGRRASRPRMPAIVVVPSTARIRPETTNRLDFARPWPSTWSSAAAMRQRPADRRGEGEQAHVLDAGVGQHALEVALGDDQQRRDRERQQPGGDEQSAHQPGPERRRR